MCSDRQLTEEDALAALDGMLRYYAKRIARSNPMVEADDLYQVGAAAVVEYVRSGRYDQAIASLRTALLPRVRGAMLDEVRRQSWLPRLEVERLKADGDDGVKVVKFSEWHPSAKVVRSNRHETAMIRFDPPHRDPEPSDHPEVEFLSVVRGLCSGLSAVERRILVWYYVRGLLMIDIGARLGLSESRVSQIHTEIMQRVRGTLPAERNRSADKKSDNYRRRKDGFCIRCRQPVGGGSTVYCAHHMEQHRQYRRRRSELARAES